MNEIIEFVLGPAKLLTKGMVGLMIGLGSLAIYPFVAWVLIIKIPMRIYELTNAMDNELKEQLHYDPQGHRGLFAAVLRVLLPLFFAGLVLIAFDFIPTFIYDMMSD